MANDSTKSEKSTAPYSLKSHWGAYWGTEKGNGRSTDPGTVRGDRAVWAVRILLIFVMITLLSLLGWLAYKLLSDQEEKLGMTQFESISQRALLQAKGSLVSRRWAGVTLAQMIGEMYPNVDQWPYIEWQGFETVVNGMLKTSQGEDMGFVPFVKPENLTEFEAFAKAVYKKMRFPSNTAVKDWGFGVWARNKTGDTVQLYHDTTGWTPYGSPYDILAPIFRTDEGFHNILLFNIHSQKTTGQEIDRMLICSERRKAKYEAQVAAERVALNGTAYPSFPPNQCGVITDVFLNIKLGGRYTVGNFNPVYPKNDPLTVVGYIPAMHPLDTLLENMFPSSVTGIDAVFESETQTITFRIEEGKARLIGEGALYNPKYKDFQRGIHLADPELFKTDDGNNKEKYLTFSLTPSEEFFDTYETQGPITAVIVVVSSILATILVFFLYDFNVRREFNAKKDLLEARKQFMRFVSHEVRTPLNAVSMGLDLMQSEVAKVLGFDCSTSFRAEHDMIDDEAYENSDDGSGFNFDVENPAIDSSEKNPLPEKTSGAESLGASTDEVIISSQKAKSWFQLSQEIQGNAQGAVDILNDLLNYDKIEQGNLQLSLEMISIWELVEKAILEFKVPASSKKVSLCIAFGEETRTTPRAPDLPADIRCLQVAGDPVRLLQVVRNLMSNALKFTPVGGSIRVEGIYLADQEAKEGPLEESIYLEDDESTFGTRRGSIRVRVIDSGAGMSEAQLANLFQEGVQFNVNELQAGGGSGLGLYIAKGIMIQHDGSITASSEGLGCGTIFEMNLPLWEITSDVKNDYEITSVGGPIGEQTDKTGTMSFTHDASLMLPKAKLKILVVDDVKSNRKLLMRLLENKGHSCDEAENGEEAVELVRKAGEEEVPYDTILLDYEMPVMDGPNAAKVIRHTLLDDETNIIGVTGNVLPEDVEFFRRCGANDVLGKPVKIKELQNLWQKHCILLVSDES